MGGAPILEACVDAVGDAAAAVSLGAARVELCAALEAGGLTPGAGAVLGAREALGPGRLVVLVRPRGGDFVHDPAELDVMRRDVRFVRESGSDGVAFGILRADGTLDVERCAELVELARPLPATLHRAFDRTPDPDEALEQAVRAGFARVLTAGGAASAAAGTEVLAALVRRAAGRVEIVAAGGVRASDVRRLVAATGVPAVHAGPRRRTEGSGPPARPELGALGEAGREACDLDEIRRLVEALGRG